MEVIGVIAAVPELVKLVKHTYTAIGQISSKARTAEICKGVRTQLDLLHGVLHSVQLRHEAIPLSGTQATRLAPVVRDLNAEIKELERLVGRVESSKDGPGFLSRIQLVLTGVAKEFEKHTKRIESLNNLLQTHLSEFTIQLNQKAQLQKLLKPSSTEFIPRNLEGTSNWIWSHNTFNRWLGSGVNNAAGSVRATEASSIGSNRILVIYGIKGCGKSVLSASVVNQLKRRGSTTLFFSFWASDDRDRRSGTMLRTLLWQLLQSLPQDNQIRHIARLLENRASLEDVNELALELHRLSAEQKGTVYCVLDGIDESVDDWNDIKDGPLSLLMNLLQSNEHVRLMLAGRQSSLRSALQQCQLRIEITRELVHSDLSRLISSELDNCPNIADESVRESIRVELEKKSTIMFLWIKLVFKELRLAFSPLELNTTLHRLPDGLDREYHRLFTILMTRLHGRLSNPSVGMARSRSLLGLIVGALRPLTMSELQHLHAISTPAVSNSWLDNLPSEDGIIDACGDFITVRDGLVYLGHTSVREFLLRPVDHWQGQDASISYFCLEAQKCQRMIGLACFQYLKQVNWLAQDPNNPAEPLVRQYPLLQYASFYMASHLLNSDMRIAEILDDLYDFFQRGEMSAWVEFVAYSESDENSHMVLPASVWDDILQLCITVTKMPGSNLESTPFDPKVEPWKVMCNNIGGTNDNRATLLQWLSKDMLVDDFDPQSDHENNLYTLQEREQNIASGLGNLKHLVIRAGTRYPTAGFHQLATIMPMAQRCLQKVGTLAHPFDIFFQSLERTLKSISFVPCMAIARSIQEIRPDAALRAYHVALQKVEGKEDLREAWAHASIGNVLNNHDERGKKLGLMESHYRRCMEVLGEMHRNPLVDAFWCEAARCCVFCLLELGRSDEARQTAKNLESRLLQKTLPKSDGGFLREWCHKRLRDSSMLVRMKMETARGLGGSYWDYNLYGDVERLFDPFIREYSSVGQRYHDFYKSTEMLANAMGKLGKTDGAIRVWMNARELCRRNNDKDKSSLNFAKCERARLLWKNGRVEEAGEEFSAVDIDAYFKYDHYLVDHTAFWALISTYMKLGKKEKAIQALDEHLHTISVRSAKHVMKMLFHTGELGECERHIPQVLSRCRSNTPTAADAEVQLCWLMALSLRMQPYSPKRTDPSCWYFTTIALARTLCGERELRRIQIGQAMAYAAAEEWRAAAAIFDEIALFCSDASHCSPHCIMTQYQKLFYAQARLQEQQWVYAFLKLSQMVEELEDCPECFCWGSERDGPTLSIVGRLHLAGIMEVCGNEKQALEYTKEALWTLRRVYYDACRAPNVPREQRMSPFYLHWSDSCLFFLHERIEGTAKSGIPWELFPLEMVWPTEDVDEDSDLLPYSSDSHT